MQEQKGNLYLCDPLKNEECPKTKCQKSCFATVKMHCAKLYEDGEPIELVVPGLKPIGVRIESEYKQWVPCAERLPEKSGRYWVTVGRRLGERRVTDLTYSAKYKKWNVEDSDTEDYVKMHGWSVVGDNYTKAWMPFPEPYMGE